MRITIQLEVTNETIRDLMCCAFEGGSNYWYTGMERATPRQRQSLRNSRRSGRGPTFFRLLVEA